MAVTPLQGHEAAWAEWRAAMASSRMHHAWILAGPQGVGKGAFARAAAAALVAEPGVPQPIVGMHPDIHLPEHPPENKEEAKKREDGQAYRQKRSIPIDEIRLMQQRLTTRPTLGSRRAVILDPADDLEKAAVNALLKSLEEPPRGTFFLLVTHRIGRLLPTIRSRCRVLRFQALPDAEVAAILAREAPEADVAARAAAVAAAQGSPGVALSFLGEDLGPAHALVERIVAEGDDSFTLRGHLAEAIGARPTRERVAAVIDLARAVLARDIGGHHREAQARRIEAHGALMKLGAQAPTYNFDPGLLAMEIGGLLASAAVPRG
jgi:DNA polymerase-3 subunit delta'